MKILRIRIFYKNVGNFENFFLQLINRYGWSLRMSNLKWRIRLFPNKQSSFFRFQQFHVRSFRIRECRSNRCLCSKILQPRGRRRNQCPVHYRSVSPIQRYWKSAYKRYTSGVRISSEQYRQFRFIHQTAENFLPNKSRIWLIGITFRKWIFARWSRCFCLVRFNDSKIFRKLKLGHHAHLRRWPRR